MPAAPDVPAGLTMRPLSLTDAAAVAAVVGAEEVHDLGETTWLEADVIAEWQRPSFDAAVSTLGVFDGARLVAYAELCGGPFGAAAVDPAYRRRGLGTALAQWMRDAAREHGLAALGTHVPAGTPGDRLLESLGYAATRTAWNLELPSRDALVEVAPPPGVSLRAATAAEHETCWTVIEDAFLEWAERERKPYDDWAAVRTRRPGFEPWMLRVATDDHSGAILATAALAVREQTAIIEQLATRLAERGRGLASALISDAVAASAEHGATRWTIETDSRIGARELYERVGMQVTSTWIHREIALD